MVGKHVPHHLAIRTLSPIGVIQNTIAHHLHLLGYEYVVNTTVGITIRIEVIECATRSEAVLSIGVGVLQQIRLREDGINLIALVNIEITRE